MAVVIDLIYLFLAVFTLPIWLFRMVRTGKIRTDWPGRFGRLERLPAKSGRRILVHAVSVGEVNAIRTLVARLETASPRPEVVVCTTTDTGFARARHLWKDHLHVVRYPLDFSFAVGPFLKAIDPDAVALIELEVWPNFTAACARRAIPVCVANGRLSARSFKRYRLIRWLIRPSFRRLTFAGVQNQDYRERFITLGVKPEAAIVTGTLKWESAQISDDVPGSGELAAAMGIERSKPLIVAGSTAPGEHELLLKATPPGVQLLCAPRRPEWFDQAATVLEGCARRSAGTRGSPTGRFLLDTIGELRQAYALADLVVVGRSFGDLHGSDMMEPIALGKATIVGPAVTDFQEAMTALLAGEGVVQCSAEDLPRQVADLLADPQRRAQLARNGRAVIRSNQGATRRTVELVLSLLADRSEPASR